MDKFTWRNVEGDSKWGPSYKAATTNEERMWVFKRALEEYMQLRKSKEDLPVELPPLIEENDD